MAIDRQEILGNFCSSNKTFFVSWKTYHQNHMKKFNIIECGINKLRKEHVQLQQNENY